MFDKPDARMIDTVFPGLFPSLKTLLTNRLDRFSECLESTGQDMDGGGVDPADLVRVFLFSDFVADCLARDPGIFHDLSSSGDLAAIRKPEWFPDRAALVTAGADAEQARKLLMDFKRREIIRIAWRDLTGNADLSETLSDLSHLAMACISRALDLLYDKMCTTHGTPMDRHGHTQQMVILGMGKLGAKGVNFSSDNGLVFV